MTLDKLPIEWVVVCFLVGSFIWGFGREVGRRFARWILPRRKKESKEEAAATAADEDL